MLTGARLTLSTMNVTVPLGLPAPGATGATVAVNVTGSPRPTVAADSDTVVVVLAWFTVYGVVPLLTRYPGSSPLYRTVIVWAVTDSVSTGNVACPLEF